MQNAMVLMQDNASGITLAIHQQWWHSFFTPNEQERLRRLAPLTACPNPGDLTTTESIESLQGSRVAVTGWGTGRFTAEVLDACPHLEAIVHTAASVRGIVDDSAFDRGIVVSSQTALMAEPVAEYCLSMVINAAKGIWRSQRFYLDERDRLDRFATFGDVGLRGSIIGIVGLSQISRRLIDLLRPFELELLVHSSWLGDQEAGELGVTRVELPELMASSDVISVHSALTADTRYLIDARLIASIKDGATLINTARGAVLDQEALVRELATGRLDAILDVTDPEPTPSDSPLWHMPNVMLTPHYAGAMGRELTYLGRGAADDVHSVFAGRRPRGEVRAALFKSIA